MTRFLLLLLVTHTHAAPLHPQIEQRELHNEAKVGVHHRFAAWAESHGWHHDVLSSAAPVPTATVDGQQHEGDVEYWSCDASPARLGWFCMAGLIPGHCCYGICWAVPCLASNPATCCALPTAELTPSEGRLRPARPVADPFWSSEGRLRKGAVAD